SDPAFYHATSPAPPEMPTMRRRRNPHTMKQWTPASARSANLTSISCLRHEGSHGTVPRFLHGTVLRFLHCVIDPLCEISFLLSSRLRGFA
ncbi:MAG: hypothetical protein ABL996_21295, partial [Micropepsaceae bacterium]